MKAFSLVLVVCSNWPLLDGKLALIEDDDGEVLCLPKASNLNFLGPNLGVETTGEVLVQHGAVDVV